MLQSGKFDLVHEFLIKMKKSGEAPTALTYRGSFSCTFSGIDYLCFVNDTYFMHECQFLSELFGVKEKSMKLLKQSGIWNREEWSEQAVYIMS